METFKSSLKGAQIRLIELMQSVNFGRIENLLVRDGEPVFEPPPRVIRDVKLGGENGPRPEQRLDDFVVKAKVVDLFSCLDEIGDGTIRVLEVKHGLPFLLRVEEVFAA